MAKSIRRNELLFDIYNLMDEAGLSAGALYDTKLPLNQIVNKIRTELALKLVEYIEYQPKKIEIDFED